MIRKLQKSSYYLLMASVASGVCFILSCLPGLAIMLVPAFAIIIEIERNILHRKHTQPYLSMLAWSWQAFLFWNVGASWWLWELAGAAALLIWLGNSLLMTLPVLFFLFTKIKAANRFGYLAFICFWLAFEYVHGQWFMAWPTPNAGAQLASYPFLARFYELTGPAGGTFWLLLAALTFHSAFFERRAYGLLVAIALLPFGFWLFTADLPQSPKRLPLAEIAGQEQLRQAIGQSDPRAGSHAPDGFFFDLVSEGTDLKKNPYVVASFNRGNSLLLSPWEMLLLAEYVAIAPPQDFILLKTDFALPLNLQAWVQATAASLRKYVLVVSDDNVRLYNWWGGLVNDENPAIQFNQQQTLFSKSGNYFGRVAAFLAVFMFLAAWVKNTVTFPTKKRA